MDSGNNKYVPQKILRILASYEAKIAKICNFWTFWPVTKLINHLFKIRQTDMFCQILKVWSISLITGQDVQKVQICAIFAS